MNNKIKSLLITVVVGLIYFYFNLPPLNPTSYSFWMFVGILIATYLLSSGTSQTISLIKERKMPRDFGKQEISIIVAFTSIIFLITVVNMVLSPLFIAKTYSKRIVINEESEFVKDITKVDVKNLPVIDKESSMRLGDRVMGQMPDLVSQFAVSNQYTQINYKDKIVRVTPLEYNDIFKVFTNGKDGITGYIMVDSVSGEVKLARLNKGMKYMQSAIFSKDLDRQLRFAYPTKVFGAKNFEIDEEGNPYWIIPTLKYNGINIRTEVSGAIILNPVDGSSTYYDVKDVPVWVDHVYPADLIIEQVNDWGRYKKGFFNSIFGQKNVVVTTEGYNYTALNDDVYLYTGITSAVADQSNIGFIMSNLRTKETKFYAIPGAEEFSAMSSAEGQVQQMKYRATFPLLVNVNNKPTYFLSLKDNAGLVKMFAFVDVADYQKVVVTDSSKGIETAIKNYIGSNEVIIDDELEFKNIVVKSISMALIDGNSYYYITDMSDLNYKVALKINESLIPFIKSNDTLKVGYVKTTSLTEVIKISK